MWAVGQGPRSLPVPAAQPPWLWAGLGDLQCPGDLPNHFRATRTHFSNNPLRALSLKTAMVGVSQAGTSHGSTLLAGVTGVLDSRLKGALLPLLLGTPCFCPLFNLWDAALSVRQGRGGREAREVPSTVTLWMRAAAQR